MSGAPWFNQRLCSPREGRDKPGTAEVMTACETRRDVRELAKKGRSNEQAQRLTPTLTPPSHEMPSRNSEFAIVQVALHVPFSKAETSVGIRGTAQPPKTPSCV